MERHSGCTHTRRGLFKLYSVAMKKTPPKYRPNACVVFEILGKRH